MQKQSSDVNAEWVDVEDFSAPTQARVSPKIDETEETYRGTDFLGERGARELKRRIEAYWRDQGYEVEVKFEDGGFHPAVRSSRHDLRSDMVDGLPRRRR